ncbi:MAG: archease [Nanoarchaeota archaeon]|nr:archease [Nanoarchaeota archaeon]
MKYKFFPHTADAKFKAYGKSLEEQFSNAALAMSSIMVDSKKVKPKIKKTINIKGNDIKSLLYNFLEELLFLLDTEYFLLNQIEEIKIKDNSLKATITGDIVKDEYELLGEVKAVTYNDMEITKSYVQVVVDL